MMRHATLRKTALTKLKKLGPFDLVVGFTSTRVRTTLAVSLAKKALAGLKAHYPDLRTLILNVDVGHKDKRREAINALHTPENPVVSSRYDGVLGKGLATSALLHAALELEAQAIIILDSSTTSISPEWIPALAMPILDHGVDLVKPRYTWLLPEGGLSDLLFYPFTRAVWGGNFRHPAAPDYALSRNLMQAILQEDVWQTEVKGNGFDIWLSTFAVTENWELAQSALGEKTSVAISRPKQWSLIFKEAIGTMLRQTHIRHKHWQGTTSLKPVPTITKFAPQLDTLPIPFNEGIDYIEKLALGWMEYRSLWQRVMLPENLDEVEYLASRPVNQFYFPPDLWAKIAYDFTVVYNKGERDPDAVATSLHPLYLGRLASFWSEIAGLTTVGRAGTVAAQVVEFEEHLPYLKERWDTYLPWIHSSEVR